MDGQLQNVWSSANVRLLLNLFPLYVLEPDTGY